ncbi:hypothetical protein ACFV2X_00130 [Streptomyces sp. NPDC059679]
MPDLTDIGPTTPDMPPTPRLRSCQYAISPAPMVDPLESAEQVRPAAP